MSRVKSKPNTKISDFFEDEECLLCLKVPKQVGEIIESMYQTGLWGQNIPDVCERIISHWILGNLDNLARLGIELERK